MRNCSHGTPIASANSARLMLSGDTDCAPMERLFGSACSAFTTSSTDFSMVFSALVAISV